MRNPSVLSTSSELASAGLAETVMVPASVYRHRSVNIEPSMYAGIRGVSKLSLGKDLYKMSPVLSWTTPLAASLCTV